MHERDHKQENCDIIHTSMKHLWLQVTFAAKTGSSLSTLVTVALWPMGSATPPRSKPTEGSVEGGEVNVDVLSVDTLGREFLSHPALLETFPALGRVGSRPSQVLMATGGLSQRCSWARRWNRGKYLHSEGLSQPPGAEPLTPEHIDSWDGDIGSMFGLSLLCPACHCVCEAKRSCAQWESVKAGDVCVCLNQI